MNKSLKRAGFVLGGLLGTLSLLYAAAATSAASRLNQRFETHSIELPLPPPGDAAAILRGKHLVEARYGCQACHGSDLSGGKMIDEAPIGTVLGPNLTLGKGGRTADFTMADWDRVVRHGVKPDGTGTLMPSEDFFRMSDAELSDIVAFLRALPPVDKEVPLPKLGPVGKVLVALGKLPLAAERQVGDVPHPAAPPATAVSAEFGAHLGATCTGCHRANLAGGPMAFGPPDWPAAANLTSHASGMAAWSYADFERALTAGTSKDGHRLREPMKGVISGTRAMSETERRALWTYLRSLPATPTNDG